MPLPDDFETFRTMLNNTATAFERLEAEETCVHRLLNALGVRAEDEAGESIEMSERVRLLCDFVTEHHGPAVYGEPPRIPAPVDRVALMEGVVTHEIANITVFTLVLDTVEMDALLIRRARNLLMEGSSGSVVVVAGVQKRSTPNNRTGLVVLSNTPEVHAGKLLVCLGEHVQGRGGGNATHAQMGFGEKQESLHRALVRAAEYVAETALKNVFWSPRDPAAYGFPVLVRCDARYQVLACVKCGGVINLRTGHCSLIDCEYEDTKPKKTP